MESKVPHVVQGELAGGIINADNNWVTSESWEMELGARRRAQQPSLLRARPLPA